ncbi:MULTISPECIES: DUF6378 domain-containing protein [Glaesserella]|uniref:DUF6378 domain-containing protein n=1 Tax=Glaesserella australis TaxID=2094024 RepID=A0A328C3B8_9PAST|nr:MULTISPECIES: DUF6378 domain-containing protein [Glaesserella]AUI65585.1 hypothetical protein CJD39_02875 [Glaesserella sp. 15-184]RAL19782.1 hypothetical protein C5N92_01960 [Glaesserella australis]
MNTTDILNERQQTHGDFATCAQIAQEIKLVIAANDNCLSHQKREALEMIAVKMARILNGGHNHKDSWQDIAGYAMLGGGLFTQKDK